MVSSLTITFYRFSYEVFEGWILLYTSCTISSRV